AAKAGNIAAIIFWLKTRARWRERTAADEATSAADGESNSEILLLPNNSRDPELTGRCARHKRNSSPENGSGGSSHDPANDPMRKSRSSDREGRPVLNCDRNPFADDRRRTTSMQGMRTCRHRQAPQSRP